MKPKLLIVGDSSLIHTGFGRVVKEIATGLFLTDKYDIKTIGWFNWHGQKNQEVVPYEIISTKPTKDDMYSAITFNEVVSTYKPDIVLACGDLWMVESMVTSPFRNTYKLVLYVPIDGIPVSPRFRHVIEGADILAAYGNFGANAILKAKMFPKKMVAIPHGVDVNTFKPIDDKTELKKKYKSEGLFVTGSVCRNQPRKNIPKLIQAFSLFSKGYCICHECGEMSFSESECDFCGSKKVEVHDGKKEARLYLHTPGGEEYGWNIPELISFYGVEGKVIIPPKMNVGAGVSSEILSEIYNLFDIFTLPTTGEGWCFRSGTMIKKDIGFEKIENVKSGDVVISHTGKLCKVISPLQRKYQGEIISINPRCGKNIESTPNHPWFVVKRMSGCFDKTRRHLLQYKDISPEWIPAENISKGDLLVIPKTSKLEKSAIKSIKISNVLEIESNDDCIHTNGYAKCEIGLLEISKKFDIAFQTVSKMIREDNNSPLALEVRKYAESVGYKTEKRKYKDEIEITPELLFSFGHYIAEGSGRSSISLAMHKDEIYAQKIQEVVFRDAFGLKSSMKKCNGNKAEVYCCSSLIASFYKKLFGDGAYNKHIPDIFKNKEHAPHIVRGYFYGDGSFGKNEDFSFSSVSEKLCYDIKECLMLLDIPSNFTLDNRGCYNLRIPKQYNERFIEKINPIKYNTPCQMSNKVYKNTSFIEDADNFYAIVDSVKRSMINDTVYNLSVEEDNSYVVEDYAVHNCLPIAEAMACGIPVVATDYSGHVDFCAPCAELIRVSEYVTEVNSNILRAIVDINDYVMRLDKLYYNDSTVFNKKWGKYLKEVYPGAGECVITGLKARKMLSSAGRKQIENYSWDKIIPQWDTVVSSLVSKENKNEKVELIKA